MNPYKAMVIEVAAQRGLCPAEIINCRRGRRPVAQARQEVFWRLNLRGNSLPKIGQWADRDHTSVLFGVRAHHERYHAEHAARWPR